MASAGRYFAKQSDAEDFARSLLLKSGLPDDHAGLMARCLVQADTRGVASCPSSARIYSSKYADSLARTRTVWRDFSSISSV
jgi:LDH2 family malate/lactate/ureidoglycolate dehydrogenase